MARLNGQSDLFGNPVDPQYGQPGRPRHKPTLDLRALVTLMHEAGETQVAIAKVLRITEKTLRLNYPQELQTTSRAWRKRAN